MGYRYCEEFNRAALTFNGRIDVPGAPVFALCCEMIPGMPTIPFEGTPFSLLRNFFELTTFLNAECQKTTDDNRRIYTAGCLGCAHFVETQESPPKWDGLIHHVNISSYPAPCQSHCFYCWVHDWDERFTPQAKEGYDKMLHIIELAEKSGLLAPDVKYQLSSGEIAIHPYHDQLMKFVKGKKAIFFTNCMKYDTDIAQNLSDNPESSINLSIDSGTAKTWAKVKGVNNFDTVIENLTKYFVASTHPEQITIKYIVFPDINDNYDDYISLMEILKVLEVKELTITRDGRVKYVNDSEYRVKLFGGVAYLAAICIKNEIKPDWEYFFSLQEQSEIKAQIDEILQNNLI